jgi:hypothetical protein
MTGFDADSALATIESDLDGADDAWAAFDLDPYLSGDVRPVEPSVGIRRSDGLRLLYPGHEHVLIGEMESGKTWFAAASAAAELEHGHDVVYVHFEESTPVDLIERLRALGVPDDAMRKWLRFVAPDSPVTIEARAQLLDPAPTLVVLDGVNEAMALHSWAVREEAGAADFRRHLVKPFLRVGAATLACDHVVKDKESRGRYALGSIHKGNGVNGAIILLEAADPYGRRRRGRSRVYITKDRPGHLRQHGRPDQRLTGKTYIGELVVDDEQQTTPDLELNFYAPKADSTVPKISATDAAVWKVVCGLTSAGTVATQGAVREAAAIRASTTDASLDRLVDLGVLIESKGKRNARVFTPSQDRQKGDL